MRSIPYGRPVPLPDYRKTLPLCILQSSTASLSSLLIAKWHAIFPIALCTCTRRPVFLLDAILEIEELGCLEINHDASGPPLAKMIPYYRQVQDAGRSLVVRGAFTPDELRMLMEVLDQEVFCCSLWSRVRRRWISQDLWWVYSQDDIVVMQHHS